MMSLILILTLLLFLDWMILSLALLLFLDWMILILTLLLFLDWMILILTLLLFLDWILPVPSDDRKAKCKYCEVLLPAHHAGLCGHALDKKHLKKLSEYTSSMELDLLVNNLERGSSKQMYFGLMF